MKRGIAISITSLLSIFGATFIILSYVAFRKIRTQTRQFLVNLSIADLVLALSSLIGALVYYGNAGLQEATEDSDMLQRMCAAQAAFTMFGVLSTMFWTVAVAFYLCVLVVLHKQTGWVLVVVLYVVCWGIPGVLTIWLGVSEHLGLDQGATNGFCAVIPGAANSSDPYVIVVGYDMWLYLAFILLPAFYATLHYKLQPCALGHCCSLSRRPISKGDRKLAFVPLVFLFLRVWSIVVDVSIYYLPKDDTNRYRQSTASEVIGILEGIGIAGQGFANGVLFCLLTKAVRKRILAGLVCGWCWCRTGYEKRFSYRNDESEPINQRHNWASSKTLTVESNDDPVPV
ncbi:hypothetical protein EMCRGX_G011123 [Ephydatia muelleri]